MKQLDLFQWADSRPSATIINLMPAVIKRICAQPYPFPPKEGQVVPLASKIRVV